VKVHDSDSTTGYGTDDNGNKACFDCCGIVDKMRMVKQGRAVLYLDYAGGTVSNWPGTYKVNVWSSKTGRHNIAGKRYDVWFKGPDGHYWHGVTYGDYTQICHCKRTKEKYAA